MASLAAICGWSNSATAADTVDTTTVRATGNMGEFDIQLLDPWTPATAANFLGYVERGDYSNSFIHRSVPGFILQGGGFAWRSNQITEVPKRASVTNEPYFSNVRGTVAMAKMGGDPHSATPILREASALAAAESLAWQRGQQMLAARKTRDVRHIGFMRAG